MSTVAKALAAAAALVVVTGLPLADPAGAAVTATASGTEVTVAASGSATIHFGCDASSNVTVDSVATSPTLACSALTRVSLSGDGGSQVVFGSDLDAAAFSAEPDLSVDTGGGDDVVYGTRSSDAVDLGGDDDTYVLAATSVADESVDLGAGSDHLVVEGTAEGEELHATATDADLTVAIQSPSADRSYPIGNVEHLTIDGNGGNDQIGAGEVEASSAIDSVTLDGGAGDDELTASPLGSTLRGRTGTNLLQGSDGPDQIESESATDTIAPGNGEDAITDQASLHSGGRTLLGSGSDTWTLAQHPGDSVARIRPNGSSGAATLTASLSRNGIQALPGSLRAIEVDTEQQGQPESRSLVDAVSLPGGTEVHVDGDRAKNDLVDFMIPVGGWTITTRAGTTRVHPTQPGQADLVISSTALPFIHNPWTNPNQAFAHRAYRDLLFRWATAEDRNTIQTQIDAGTATRASVVRALTSTDEYRGLDVDRVFLAFLRRASDKGGRTYWINSLRNGKSLTRFRAQLFGSNEYFSKAGGTNAAYMTTAYSDVLGRAPDPSGQAYWTNKLDHGADRGAVALQFLASTEARRNIVKDQFLRFLDRYPTAAETSTWVAKLNTSQGEPDLVRFLAASNAYFART